MALQSVTVNLPQEIYQRAKRVARATRRSLDQVVVSWIQPPPEPAVAKGGALEDLDALNDADLAEIARSEAPFGERERLRRLLALQQRRDLTASERREAADLVVRQDFVTLRRARALYLLKQRNALPRDLADLLSDLRQ